MTILFVSYTHAYLASQQLAACINCIMQLLNIQKCMSKCALVLFPIPVDTFAIEYRKQLMYLAD